MATTITIEDVKKARAYMPVAEKEALSRMMAKLCVRVVENDAGTSAIPLPTLRVEDRLRRLQFLHGVLCGYYLGAAYEKEKLRYKDADGNPAEREIALCMSADALDKWLESQPMNQFERLKKEKQIANKVYDLLYDFKAFELMLNGAIREEMDMGNDPALRIAQVLATQTTPEAMRETMKIMEEYKTQVSENV